MLYNGVDLAAFQAAVSDPAEHLHSFVMLGRMGARKGTYDFIEAAALAVKQAPGLTICIAGDGEVERIRGMVAEKELGSHVTVLDWVDGEKKLELLKNAAAVVLPSYHEGLPMAILGSVHTNKDML